MTTGTGALVERPVPAAGEEPPAESPLRLAERAVEVVQAAPDQAEALARAALACACDVEVVVVAERALGLAARERGDLQTALVLLRRATSRADRAGLRVRAGQVRTSLSLALAQAGRTASALREADRAADVLTGRDAARLQMQRALVLQRLGRAEEALEGYRSALTGFRRHGDLLWEARLRSNRGALHVYRGALPAAEEDLRRAEQLAAQLGQDLLLAHVRHNRGFLAARRGDVPTALRAYAGAEEHYRAHGGPLGMLLLDRCELLASVRVLDEALAAGREALEELAAAGAAADLAEGRVLLASAALLAGDTATAATSARAGAEALARQRRGVWAALARSVESRARAEAGECSAALLRLARDSADVLQAGGLVADAARARLVAGQVALGLGRTREAEQQLTQAAAVRDRGPALVRAHGWHACALLRLSAGDRRGALTALAAGLRALDGARDALGASELRARAGGAAEELARLGVRLALDSGRPRQLLAWSERCRAGALRRPPVRVAEDPLLVADLGALRTVAADLEDAALSGRSTRGLLDRQAALERRVQERARQAHGGQAPADVADRVAQVLPALGERALVELLRCDDALWAVVATTQRVALRRLPGRAEVEAELAALRFALRRLAVRHGSPASLALAQESALRSCARLDALLLHPLAGLVEARPLVLVPTGPLHAVPWALLPSLAGRPVTVAPSALVWHRAAVGPRAGLGGAVFVSGPGLAHADQEVHSAAARYASPVVLTHADATAARVLGALDGAALAHVAAHGRFRADNAQFSSLRLVDGPVTVYDLERLVRPPEVLVLSACDSGLSAVHAGDELMGLVAALLALGTRSTVASVAPVDDAATRLLMERLHDRLRAGEPPSAALAGAQQQLVAEGTLPLSSVGAFTCFGAG